MHQDCRSSLEHHRLYCSLRPMLIVKVLCSVNLGKGVVGDALVLLSEQPCLFCTFFGIFGHSSEHWSLPCTIDFIDTNRQHLIRIGQY